MTLPFGAKDIIAVRKRGYVPKGGVFLTDRRWWFFSERKMGLATVLLEGNWDELDLRFCHAVDVFVAHEEHGEKLAKLGQRLLEIDPKSLFMFDLTTGEAGYVVGGADAGS